MLEFADFPSFRALAEIAPLPVLLVPEHRTRFLDLLEGHSATGNQSGTRVLALGIVSRLVERCAEAGTPTLLPVLVPRPEPEEEDEMDGVLVEEVPRAEELALDAMEVGTKEVVPGAVFVPAAGFEGSRPGYVFKMGSRGLGYYKDGVPEDAKDTEDALDMDALE